MFLLSSFFKAGVLLASVFRIGKLTRLVTAIRKDLAGSSMKARPGTCRQEVKCLCYVLPPPLPRTKPSLFQTDTPTPTVGLNLDIASVTLRALWTVSSSGQQAAVSLLCAFTYFHSSSWNALTCHRTLGKRESCTSCRGFFSRMEATMRHPPPGDLEIRLPRKKANKPCTLWMWLTPWRRKTTNCV